MAKTGERQPHKVSWEWSNGVKGSKTFRTEEAAEAFAHEMLRNAESAPATLESLFVTERATN